MPFYLEACAIKGQYKKSHALLLILKQLLHHAGIVRAISN